MGGKSIQLMNIHTIISLPFIGFGVFTLITESLGYNIQFQGCRIKFKKGNGLWDPVNIWIIFLSAVVYAGSLASTVGITIISGYTWIRPGNMMAPLLGYIFGLPGCIGVGLGELLTDSFSGYYSWGSIGGFIGNFILAYIPYKVLRAPPLKRFKGILSYCFLVGIGSVLACAYIIVGLLDIIGSMGYMHPIPILVGDPPPIEVLSEEALWNGFFPFMILNNVPMSLIAGFLIVISFNYLSEKGLYWKDRLGLFESRRGKEKFIVYLIIGILLSYMIYNVTSIMGVYGRIGRYEDYLTNIIGILFFIFGILGFSLVSIDVVKGRILSILIGKRSIDARALEVFIAARRELLTDEHLREKTGERLGTILFTKFLQPNLRRLLRRLRMKTFVEDYLKYILLYMMNCTCQIKKGLNERSRVISIDECVACKNISSTVPVCHLLVGFVKGLTETFAANMDKEDLKIHVQETECKATGQKHCKIVLSWE
jgi:energy-coupling factor transport system substrate-specific component